MKKITTLLAIFVFFHFNANAQEGSIEYGIKAGVNYASFAGDINSGAKFKGGIGFHLGGFLSYSITEKIKLKPELIFSQQSSQFVLNIENFFGDFDPVIVSTRYVVDIKESLILVPILLDYYLTEDFDLEIGPQFGYVISQDVSDNNDNFIFRGSEYDAFDLGISIGAGYTFAENFRVGTRLNYAITKRDRYNSSVLRLSLNYIF